MSEAINFQEACYCMESAALLFGISVSDRCMAKLAVTPISVKISLQEEWKYDMNRSGETTEQLFSTSTYRRTETPREQSVLLRRS
jgi:hypothetical protein